MNHLGLRDILKLVELFLIGGCNFIRNYVMCDATLCRTSWWKETRSEEEVRNILEAAFPQVPRAWLHACAQACTAENDIRYNLSTTLSSAVPQWTVSCHDMIPGICTAAFVNHRRHPSRSCVQCIQVLSPPTPEITSNKHELLYLTPAVFPSLPLPTQSTFGCCARPETDQHLST